MQREPAIPSHTHDQSNRVLVVTARAHGPLEPEPSKCGMRANPTLKLSGRLESLHIELRGPESLDLGLPSSALSLVSLPYGILPLV